jgi:ligand-binding sensor domain-containing protein
MKKSLFFISLCLLFACNSNRKKDDTPQALYQAPIIVELNTKDGYAVNPVTGDSIKPIINRDGDTIKTGVPIEVVGKKIRVDSLPKPQVVNAGKFKTVDAHPNVYKIPEKLNTTKVITKLVKKSISDVDTSSFILINSAGDTIPTGVPIPAKGKIVPAIQPKLVKASPMRMKDDAIYHIKYLDEDDGLPSSYIHAITQDGSGYLWFATFNQGIVKFDGQYLLNFTMNEGLISNNINSIIIDKSGKLWASSNESGVSCFDGHKFTNFTETDRLSSNQIIGMLEDEKGNIWFSTKGAGVSCYDGKNFTNYTIKEGLFSNDIKSVFKDNKGKIIVVTPKGINIFNGKFFDQLTIEGLNLDRISSCIADKSGNLWFANYPGVYRYQNDSLTYFTEADGLSNKQVNYIYEDKSGIIWFASWKGVTRYDGKSFIHIKEEEGLCNRAVFNIYEDGNSNLWLGTSDGLICYYKNSFNFLTEKEGLNDNQVLSIGQTNTGNLLFTSVRAKGIAIYDSEKFTYGLEDKTVLDVKEDRNGNLWMSTFEALHFFDGINFSIYTKRQGLLSNFIYQVLEDKTGRLWITYFFGGISLFDGEYFTHFTDKESTYIFEDSTGKIWFYSRENGVCSYDGKAFTFYSEKEGLISNEITSIYEDALGNIWFTTIHGVSCFNGNSFVQFTESQGLISNYVTSVVQDKNGAFWFTTNKGISILTNYGNQSGTSSSDFRFINLQKEEGLKKTNEYYNSSLIDKANRIWWGSHNGAVMLDLNKFTFAETISKPLLGQITINGKTIDFRNPTEDIIKVLDYSAVQPFQNYPINLNLPYDYNHLSFYFTALEWLAPQKIKYQHMLTGLDQNWSIPSDQPTADYRNIPHGTYTFKVRAIGQNQIWSEPFEYTFTIHPPWWHTWWFRSLMAGTFILLLFLIYRWRTAALRQRQLILEQTVEQRTKEVVKQKDIVEEKQKEIVDSINYAKRIQAAILPPSRIVKEMLPNSFVIYKPKDIVAGDFYWMHLSLNPSPQREGKAVLTSDGTAEEQSPLSPGRGEASPERSRRRGEVVFFAAADCTGHGVPGAMVSVICNNGLNRSVREYGLTDPGKILDKTREIVIQEFEKSDEEVKDGMDISLCALEALPSSHSSQERAGVRLHYAGANNPLG